MLKVLMLRKKLDLARNALSALREKDADFERRQGELETAIGEVTNEEERAEAEKMVSQFETERTEHENQEAELESQISDLERELGEAEAAQDTTPPAGAPAANPKNTPAGAERNDRRIITMKRNLFNRMSVQERDAFFAREDVKGYLNEVRSAIREKRALTNIGLTIPQVLLPMLKEAAEENSKLLKYVNVQTVGGEARIPVMGTIPEAFWTECCANLNEMDLAFSDAELDCYKVGGYYAVCNATLEDSDVDLASLLLTAIGKGIGIALDKAILFGRNAATNQKMPLGIATRLVQTTQPSGYPATARPWVDLHASNVKTIASSVVGADLIKALIATASAAVNKYTGSAMTWVMNKKTYTKIMGASVSVNAQGQIVAGVANTMPVVGGDIVQFEGVPDNMIVAGYFDLYLLGERAGNKFASSEHVRFLSDQTVFKGTARYDGTPVIAEGFVFIGIDSTTPDVSGVTFAQDIANDAPIPAIAMNTAAATIEVGKTVQLFALLTPGMGDVTWDSATKAKATVDENGVVTGVAAGTSVISATSDGLTATATVTVVSGT